jgi:hypothetical protein
MQFRNDKLCVLRMRSVCDAPAIGPFPSEKSAWDWCDANMLSRHCYQTMPFIFVGDEPATLHRDTPTPPPEPGDRYCVLRVAADRNWYPTQQQAATHAEDLLRTPKVRGTGTFVVAKVVEVVTDNDRPALVRPIFRRQLVQGELPLTRSTRT